jgi:hypothetical protein
VSATPGVSRRLRVRVRVIAAGVPVAIAGAMAIAAVAPRNPRRPAPSGDLLANYSRPLPFTAEWFRVGYCALVRGEDILVCRR